MQNSTWLISGAYFTPLEDYELDENGTGIENFKATKLQTLLFKAGGFISVVHDHQDYKIIFFSFIPKSTLLYMWTEQQTACK